MRAPVLAVALWTWAETLPPAEAAAEAPTLALWQQSLLPASACVTSGGHQIICDQNV